MIKVKGKLTSDLNNNECFKFKDDQTNYRVVDWIYYVKEGTKKKKLLPIKTYVKTFKNL
jgi:hypothetical protein